ncbi:hypothetical protein AB0A99_15820 [Streptomyces fradiae]|uniref:hypothetical protein n=1 Tax=Streptomyces fradiae TaxID=1906 RepID=UPI0033D0055B
MTFEDELGEALRHVGGTFDTDRQERLIMTATEEGRRSVRRRRAFAVAASVAALGVLGTGAYASGVLPDRDRDSSVADEKRVVGGDRVFAVFERLLPGGKLTQRKVLPRKPGEYVHTTFVYEDPKGGSGLVDFRMGVADPRMGEDGGRPLRQDSHEPPYKTLEARSSRQQLTTPEGHFIDLTVWNTPRGASGTATRPAPVLYSDLWRLLNANEWRAELAGVPRPDPLLGETPMDPAWVDPPATVSGPGMAATLRSLLPKGAVTAPAGRGTDDDRGPAASLRYDDGRGPAGVTVELFRVDPDGYSTRQYMVCRSSDCTRTRLPDGTQLTMYDARDGSRRETKRVVRYVSGTGDMVEVAVRATDAERPAAQPPLTREQLKAVAMSPKWRTALGALPAAPDEETGGPTRYWDMYRAMFTGLPGRHVWNEDGLGPGLVEARVDTSRRNTGAEPVIDVRQERVEGGGEGVVRWVVTGAAPGGRYVTLTAYNAPAPDADATRTTPPLGIPALKACVLSPLWESDKRAQWRQAQ